MSDLFDLVQVTETYVLLKFSASVKSSTLINSNFVLSNADATPSQVVANPFKTIDLVKDYKSISRTLYLWWDVILAGNTDYLLTVSNIQNAMTGIAYPVETLPFTTTSAITPDDEERPTREPLDVEDYSIKDPSPLNGSSSSSSSSGSATPGTQIVVSNVVPTVDDSYYLETTDFDGKITVSFSEAPDTQFVNSANFTVHQKTLTSGLSKWIEVVTTVTADNDDVVIELTDGWEVANKYRLTINKNVATAAPNSSLGISQEYYFLGELHPLYIDPNEVLIYYSDGDIVEITEYVYWASKDLEYILGKTDIVDITPLMHDFVLASVLCKLSRIYIFDGGMNGFTTADSFTLGDLSVKKESGSSGGSSGNGNSGVDTWCDLAAILRAQLSNTGAGMKAVVKGSNFPNPIPERALRRFD